MTSSNDAIVSDRSARHVEDDLKDSLLRAVAQSALRTHPCVHSYFEHLFPADFYLRLLANLPPRACFHELRHRDAMRADGSSTRLRMYLYPENLWRIPAPQRGLWSAVADVLMSGEVQDAFKRKFRDTLEARFRRSVEDLSFYPVPILVRDQPGYRIGIHADVGSKAITVQFYLPGDGSQRHLGTVFHAGRDGAAAEEITTMSFMPNTGYAFPVVPHASWHSVMTTGSTDGERCSLMLTYYVQDGVRAWCKRRYDRARSLVGLGPRG
ncbi:MAG: hypothetical protein KIS79_10880 [Burkholderiales bacterium]|nr:hypothetical protein [Burkholderiales bacterium]